MEQHDVEAPPQDQHLLEMAQAVKDAHAVVQRREQELAQRQADAAEADAAYEQASRLDDEQAWDAAQERVERAQRRVRAAERPVAIAEQQARAAGERFHDAVDQHEAVVIDAALSAHGAAVAEAHEWFRQQIRLSGQALIGIDMWDGSRSCVGGTVVAEYHAKLRALAEKGRELHSRCSGNRLRRHVVLDNIVPLDAMQTQQRMYGDGSIREPVKET